MATEQTKRIIVLEMTEPEEEANVNAYLAAGWKLLSVAKTDGGADDESPSAGFLVSLAWDGNDTPIYPTHFGEFLRDRSVI